MLGRVGLPGLALALVLGASAARAMPDAAHGDISPTVPEATNLIDPRSALAEPAQRVPCRIASLLRERRVP